VGELIEPQPGTGAFLLALSRRGVPILPAGLFEEGGALSVRFGPPFSTAIPKGVEKGDHDRIAREQVMVRIGRLLPRHLWGVYTLRIEEALARGRRIV
jgi:hypothetical protein